MASQRNRGPRGGQRTGGHDTETMSLWNAIQEDYRKISQYEALAAEVSQQIIDKEREIKDKEPTVPSLADLVQLEELYRRGVRLAEEADAVKEGHGQSLADKIGILTALKKSDEEESSMAMGRNPSSRQSVASSAMELDGSADSPMASPAPRKLGGSGNRVSSQPPSTVPVLEISEKEDRSETGSNNSKTKITFAVNDEVAFKPKQQPGQDATDWIQGIVTKVIGEGKSRRYDVKDPYPSEGEVSLTYRSSASSMVPVPRVGTQLPDFEVGREVLGLYPGSSCFYRAEVKAMKGDKVELLFEDDEADTQRLVERRFVLDYRVTKDGKK